MFNFLKRTLFEPRIAFGIFIIFIIIYLVFLDAEGAFTNNFLKFGPDESIEFLNMKVDSWTKVILIYIISFIGAILTRYYSTVFFDFIHSKVWNPAYKDEMDISKKWTSVIITVDPLLWWILHIINFFITLTMRLQFLIPQFIGGMVVSIPYALMKISEKKFKK